MCIRDRKYTIEDCPTILRICSRLKEDVDTSDDWNWQNIKSYMKSETSESTSVLAYAFYLHFITFFNSYQSIISKRKIKDSPSKREKQLIGDLIFFTGIIQNESISTDPDYLKTLIKRYKDYQLPNGTFTYWLRGTNLSPFFVPTPPYKIPAPLQCNQQREASSSRLRF